jgi:MoxR-like ATPase
MTTQSIAKAVRSFQNQATELNGAFLERKVEINLLQVALIARQPLVFLGQAGVGKSALVNTFAQTLEDKSTDDQIAFWQYLLGKYTTPSEIFGVQSVKELRENDRFVINPTGKLPQAVVAFLDEVFKANSALLNSLLTVLNERQFDDGTGVRKDVPLELMVGASNEMPEEGEGLEALWDRFVLRHVTQDIERDDSFISLLTGEGIGEVNCEVSREDIQTLRDLAQGVDISNVIPVLLQLRQALQDKAIRVSARKWRKAVEVIKATSALKGRSVATPSDVGVLSSVLWDNPDQIDAIRSLLAQFSSDDVKTALRLSDLAREEFNALVAQGDQLTVSELGRVKNFLRDIGQQLQALDTTEEDVSEAQEQVIDFQNQVKRLTLGMVGRRR